MENQEGQAGRPKVPVIFVRCGGPNADLPGMIERAAVRVGCPAGSLVREAVRKECVRILTDGPAGGGQMTHGMLLPVRWTAAQCEEYYATVQRGDDRAGFDMLRQAGWL